MRLPRRTQDDIVLVSLDGTSWRDLTDDKFFDGYPRWSYDGKRVAFVSDRGGSYEVWTIDAEGTNLRQVTFNTSPNASFPVWAPDGARLLFRKESNSYIIDINKGWEAQTPEQVPQPPTGGDFFGVWDWSPDGSKLAGTFAGPSGTGFGYYSFETGRYERVLDINAHPFWLPDSRRVVYAYEEKVYIADIVTRKAREIIARPPNHIRSVAVSRDGRLLYYTLLSTENDIWLLNLE